MVRIFSFPAFLIAALAASGFSSPAGAVGAASVASQGALACLVGLGSGDGSPAWSQLDVTSSRSVDLDLADGAGLTVACGTFAVPNARPAAVAAPVRDGDPSTKGDFGSL